jgi:hypothetical protein
MGAWESLGIEALKWNLWTLEIQELKLPKYTSLLQHCSLFRTEMLREKPALKKQAQQTFKLERM